MWSVPNRPSVKLPSGRYGVSVLVQNLSKVHHGDGICNDQPEVGFGEGLAWTRSPTEPPHRIHVSEDLGFGRVYEAVWVKDLRVRVHIFVTCVNPCARIVRSGYLGVRGTKGLVDTYQTL